MTTYAERHQSLYTPLREEGIFTWDSMYGQEYALASYYLISDSFHREIAYATEQLAAIFAKTVAAVRLGGEELLRELSIPPAAFAAVQQLPTGLFTAISRFDFAPTEDGLKLLEFNSDTPTGIVEAYHVNGWVCSCLGLTDPNQGMEIHLRDALQRAVKEYAEAGHPTERIVFSSLGWHEEDRGTTEYLRKVSGLAAHFVPLSDLRLFQDRLCAPIDGQLVPIDVWYRLHALEVLAEDRDIDGFPTGERVLDLIARGKVAVINPPGALLAQTKALQALIWNLHEQKMFFTEDEQTIISKYMLPTYLDNVFVGSTPYVTKPVLGREGGAVILYDQKGKIEERDSEKMYWDQPMVYQKRVEMKTLQRETAKGPFEGHLLWGSFWVDGRPSAILARLDGKITGNMSYFLPVGIEE